MPSIHPDARRGTVHTDRDEVVYYDTGTPGDRRVPVLLVHGTGGRAETHFKTLYPMLAARHRVVAIDWTTSDAEETSLTRLLEQVAAVIGSRSPETAVNLVGYSLGAVVAASLAAQRPEVVRTLTLIAGWVATDDQQRLRQSIQRRLRSQKDGRLLQEFMTFVSHSPEFLRSKSPAELELLITTRTTNDGVESESVLNESIDIGGQLPNIVAPTLVVGGTADQMVPIHHSRLLFGGIPDARIAELPSGHAITAERPAHLFKLVDDFVRAPASTPTGEAVRDISI